LETAVLHLRVVAVVFVAGLALAPGASWAQTSCLKTACPAGASLQTTPDPAEKDYFYACQTEGQSAYVNFVEAAIAVSAMAFAPPKMSPTTGDPILQGQGQARLDQLRAKSGAKTLQEALSRCTKKTTPERVTVIQSVAGSDQLLVRDAAGAQAWMPKGYAEPAKK
jgi:hypothetical protein